MLTTYINIVLHNTCSLEHNMFIRSLCFVDPELVFAWVPVEAAVIYLVFAGIRRLRKSLGVGFRAEYLFLVLAAVPIINNAIHIAMALATH